MMLLPQTGVIMVAEDDKIAPGREGDIAAVQLHAGAGDHNAAAYSRRPIPSQNGPIKISLNMRALACKMFYDTNTATLVC